MQDERPDIIPIGGSVRLAGVNAMARAFGITKMRARRVLCDLGVPITSVSGEEYINVFSLETAYFRRTLPKLYERARSDDELLRLLMMLASKESAETEKAAYRKRLKQMGTDFTRRQKVTIRDTRGAM